MASYDMNALVEDFKQSGKPYTTYHKELVERAGKGNYPALVTFRKALVKAGALKEDTKGKTTQPTSRRSESEGRVVVEPLNEQERKDYETFDKVDFADWVVEHKPGVWRDFFNKDRQFELLQANYQAALEELQALKAKHGNH